MDDLVVLRNLIRSTSTRGPSVDWDVVSRSVSTESHFERIIARASSTVNIKTIVFTFEFLGIRSVLACAGTADSAEGFTRWYTRILRTVVHIDV